MWRELSEAEWRASRGHQPSGPLAVIFCVAGIIAIFAAVLAFIALRERQSLMLPSAPWTLHQLMIVTSFVPTMAMLLWGVGSFVAILTRWFHGPKLISVLTALWAACAIGSQFANMYLIAPAQGLFLAYLPLAPKALFEIALAAGVIGYMLDGFRPNLYFRRRLRAA